MVKSSENPSFDKIQKFIYRIDINSGAFVFKDPSTKFSTKEKYLSFTVIIYVFITLLLIISTLYIKKFETLSVILCFSLFIATIIFPTQIVKTQINKDIVKDLFEWCKNLYDIEKKFNSMLIHNIARTKLKKIQKKTEMFMEWFEKVNHVYIFCLVVVAPLAGVFLTNIVPKFTPTLPFYLPFEDQHNWTTFLLTILTQSMLVVHTVLIGIFIYDFFICIVLHIIGYLDIIQEIVETVFKDQIVKKVKEFDDTKPAVSKGTLKMETLMEINDSIEIDNTDNDDDLEFTEWMQILCDMITDVNCQINFFKSLYAEFFLLSEIQSFGGLFLFGLIFTVIKQHYTLAICLFLVVILLLICYSNELILEKFENVESGFYDIPWYYLSVKDQRMLLIALNCSKIQNGFTAAGIHELTLERFYAVLKAGYSNFVVLKDLCT